MSDFLPVGTIVASLLPSIPLPNGWLPCDGSQIPAKYATLLALVPNGKTPNLIGRTLIGSGVLANGQTTQTDGRNPQFQALTQTGTLSIGDTGGECTHTLNIAEMPTHSHQINGGNFGLHARSFKGEDDSDLPFETNPSTALGGTDNNGSSQPHYNTQPYFTVRYMIYAGQ